MQLRRLVLGLFLALTENILDVSSDPVTQEFLNENGIIATIDGYLPRCPGCIKYGETKILVYGHMHVPREKFYLIEGNNTGMFLVEYCGSFTRGPCDETTIWDAKLCPFKKAFLIGCNASREWFFEHVVCKCDDTHPKRWSVLVPGYYLDKPDGAFRIVFVKEKPFKRPYTPMFPNNTIYVADLIRYGHVVSSTGLFKLGSTNTGPSGQTPDLKSTVIAMVLTTFGLIMA